MERSYKKQIIFGVLACMFLAAVIFVILVLVKNEPEVVTPEPLPEEEISEQEDTYPLHEVIGASVLGREIEAFTFGEGEGEHLLFVGGIHGGYEWNSVLLAYELVDHLTENPDALPEGLRVTVIPSLNPDGVFEVIGVEGRFALSDVPEAAGASGAGRFNANNVDLNRNFDCKWQPESTWRGKSVSAGTAPFSEPEALTLRNFIQRTHPATVVFFHSQSNAVYASECEEGILPETIDVMNAYSSASGYPAVDSFDAYPITGDAEGWLASIGIPAVTVELSTHETVEWDRNRKGIEALIVHFNEKTNLAR